MPAGKDINARRSSKPKQLEAEAPARSSGGGGSRGEKFRAIRAREAASRAASQVQLVGVSAVLCLAAAAVAGSQVLGGWG